MIELLSKGTRVKPTRDWNGLDIRTTDVGYVQGVRGSNVDVFWPRIGRVEDFHFSFLKLAPSGLDVILELV